MEALCDQNMIAPVKLLPQFAAISAAIFEDAFP
jgi:hypothetical protein